MLVAGKVIYGSAAAVMLTGCALCLSETLPSDKVGSHGFAVNLGVTLGISVLLGLGALVPEDKDDSMWLLVASVPILNAIANLLVWLLFFRNESIGYCIQN